MRPVRSGVSRAVIVGAIVIIVIIIAAGGYALLGTKTTTTPPTSNTQVTSSTQQSTTSSTSVGASSSSSSSTSSNTGTTSQSSTSSVGSTSSTTSSSATGTVANPSKLVYDYVNTPTSMDPDQWTDGGSNFIQGQIYETLFGTLPGSTTVVPWLASNYSVSSDGLTYTINLRQGIKFQDGTPFNATAVIFNIQRTVLKDSSTTYDEWVFGATPGLINGSYFFSHHFGSGGANYNQSAVNAFVNSNGVVMGANPYQVIFHLGYKSAAFISDIALGGQMISPSFVISHWTQPTDGHGFITGITAADVDPYMSNHTMGTGPFELKSWDTSTQNIVLNNNPSYWGSPRNTGPSNFTEVDLNFVQSDTARVLDLKSSTADVADIPPSDYFAFIDKNAWLSSNQINLTTPGIIADGPHAENSIIWVGFNFVIHNTDGSVASFQPLADRAFRVAAADAINITDIVASAAFGFGSPANEMLPPGTVGHNNSLPTFWNYNLADAKGNLTQAATDLGFSKSNPKTVAIAYGIGDTTGQAAATEMATNINNMNLGITVQPTPLPGSLLIGQLVGGTIQMYVLEYPNPISDPNQYLTAFGVSQEAAFQGYNNSQIKSLVIQQSSELNSTLRLQEVNQINYLMNKDVFEVWLYYPSTLGEGGNGGVGQLFRSYVHGFQFNPGRANLGLYWLWKG